VSLEIGANMIFSKSKFFRRIETILSNRRGRIKKLTKLALAGTVAAVILSLGLAAVLPVGEAAHVAEDDDDSPTPKTERAKSQSGTSMARSVGFAESTQNKAVRIHPDMNKAEIVETLIQAYEVNKYIPPKGAGEARVTTVREDKTAEPPKRKEAVFLATFKFKGTKFRFDRYDIDNGRKGQLIERQIDTGEESYGYLPGKNAFRDKGGPPSHEWGELGYDFTPRSMNAAWRRSAVLRFPKLIGKADDFRTIFRDDGLLEVKISISDPSGPNGRASYVFDPSLHYRLLKVDDTTVFGDGTTFEVHYTAKYDRDSSKPYPTFVRKTKRRNPPGSKKASTYIRTVEITDFDADAQVTDKDFTFDSLGVPAGLWVADTLRDTHYRYRASGEKGTSLQRLKKGPLMDEIQKALPEGGNKK
jgi:hypothetical protein